MTAPRVARHVAHIGITVAAFLVMNALNELFFIGMEYSQGINWMFLPAGIRLLATLLFGFSGFIGLLLVSLLLNLEHFAFTDNVRAVGGALAAAGGPYLAYLFAKHWYNLGPRLENLTPRRLLCTGVLCGVASPAAHHALTWVQTGLVDWTAVAAMMSGDILGILVVLYIAKGWITLTDPRDVADYHA
jgi:hypothetical protein